MQQKLQNGMERSEGKLKQIDILYSRVRILNIATI